MGRLPVDRVLKMPALNSNGRLLPPWPTRVQAAVSEPCATGQHAVTREGRGWDRAPRNRHSEARTLRLGPPGA